MELIYLLSLLASWCLLMVKAEDPCKFFTFNVTYGVAWPLGTNRTVILVNDQFPGPEIACATNDNILVNVFNNLEVPLLLTWNGIKQRKNSWQDGVLGTNCPILPNTNFTYKFQTKDQIGSYTYFLSTGMQKAVGGYGALSVMARPEIPIPYPLPYVNVSLLIGDWYEKTHKELEQTLDQGNTLPPPDAILMNGQHQLNFTVERGKTYMFRVSNVGLATSINIGIQNHKMKLVEVEGSHVVQATFDSLDIYVGQTVTVLVTMDQAPNDYYLLASSTFTTNKVLYTSARLRYENSPVPGLVGPLPFCPNGDVSWSMKQAKSIRWDPKANAARPNPQGSFHYGNRALNRTITLENTAYVLDTKRRYAVNNISYLNPDTPLKLADNLSIDGVFNIGFPPNVSSERSFKNGTYVLEASLHEFIEVVFINNEDTLQTWHLDGYDFFVVGMGQGKWTPASRNGTDAYNLVDAFTRHTVQVYPKCWTAIYISLDNQGMWNLRSAIWERQYLGQQFYLKVFGETSPDNEYIPTLKETILCGKAKHHGTLN
ncbi:hypothetical protein OROGR_018204 [Orobanche gracilis]